MLTNDEKTKMLQTLVEFIQTKGEQLKLNDTDEQMLVYVAYATPKIDKDGDEGVAIEAKGLFHGEVSTLASCIIHLLKRHPGAIPTVADYLIGDMLASVLSEGPLN